MKKLNFDSNFCIPPIYQSITDWSIYKISYSRASFIEDIVQETMNRIITTTTNENKSLVDELAIAMYQENQRIRYEKWKVDPEDERDFWKDIKNTLIDQ